MNMRTTKKEGVHMEMVLAALTALGLLIYLGYALLNAEKL